VTEDKVFDHLVTRTQTRETSTLTITTIASSASLVLIGLFCYINSDLRLLFGIMGFLYPLVGITYREITYWTIQKDDYSEIKKRIPEKDRHVIDNKHGGKRRRILFYSLTGIPVVGWIIILSNIQNVNFNLC